jgi:hypothetical protein
LGQINWLTGGTVPVRMTYGHFNTFGYLAVEDFTDVRDMQVTILYLMGFDPQRPTYQYAGRDFRLTDVPGWVLTDLIA